MSLRRVIVSSRTLYPGFRAVTSPEVTRITPPALTITLLRRLRQAFTVNSPPTHNSVPCSSADRQSPARSSLVDALRRIWMEHVDVPLRHVDQLRTITTVVVPLTRREAVGSYLLKFP